MEDISWVAVVTDLASKGGFVALAWYLLIKHMPGIEQRHREDRADWISEMRDVHVQCEQKLKALHETTMAQMKTTHERSLAQMEAITSRITEAIERLERHG